MATRCLKFSHLAYNIVRGKFHTPVFATIHLQFSRNFHQRTNYINTRLQANLRTMKLESQEFKSLFTPELKVLIDLFSKYNYELRIAGGAVRDLVLGKLPDDVDFATTATPDEMKNMFEKENIRMINAKGEKHGTITCRINDKENFEVTTLRIDVVTDGRHAEVEFTKDWELDSLRRDLTINSMFLSFDGTVVDFFNGLEDLTNRKLRFVGDPVSRIQEDYLRILRYFRFFGRISEIPDGHENDTLVAIKDNMHGLKRISGERIWVELKKIITGRYAADLVQVMMDLGLGQYTGLPAKPNTVEFRKVYTSCHDLDPQPLTLLPALLENEEQIYKLNERLKMSKDEVRLGLFIIQHREDDKGQDTFKYAKDLLFDTVAKETKSKERICELLKYLNERETLRLFNEYQPPVFPINGYKLLEHGVKKGPALAKTLTALREKWKESGYTMPEEELLNYLEQIKDTL